MIKCICIDDTEKPLKIPIEKWVKEGNEYTIIFATVVMPQMEMAFELEEIELDESCLPYEYFLAERFAFRESDLPKLHKLIKDSEGVASSVNEVLKKIKISDCHERATDTI